MLLRLCFCSALVAGALLAATSPSFAGFRVCNRSSASEIYVAFGHYKERNGWQSEGWRSVALGQCATLIERLTDRYYYLYAESGDYLWDGRGEQGSSNFCVHPKDPFALNVKALSDRGDNPNCEKHGYVTKRFRRIDTEKYTTFTYTFND